MRTEREILNKARVLGTAIIIGGATWFGWHTLSHKENVTGNKFVTIENNSFTYSGHEFTPYGATFYPYWEKDGKFIRGSGWINPDFPQYIDKIISMAKSGNLNTLRPTNYFDGITSTDSPNWWKNQNVWQNMDYLIKTAHDNNIFVLLDLSSYRDKLIKSGKYPYNAKDWNDFLSFVGNRYKDNSTILNYALAGEVPCPNGKETLRPKTSESLTEFYKETSEKLHTVDPNHLISTGGLSHLNEKACNIDWQSIFNLPTIDLTAVHVYSDGDRTITVPTVSDWSKKNKKPFTVEEFGFKQEPGDAVRSILFAKNYSIFEKYATKTIIFWNLGSEIAPTSYEVSPDTPLTWNTILQNSRDQP